MKKYTITAFLLLALWVLAMTIVKAQTINPYAGVEYFIDYSFTYNQKVVEQIPLLPVDLSLTNHKPQAITACMIAGFELEIFKNLSSDIRLTTLITHTDGLKFTPLQTDYTFGLKYELKRFTIRYEHKCTHPTKSMNHTNFEMYGAYDKIGIYWQLHPKSKF